MNLFSVALLLITLQADPATVPITDAIGKRIDKLSERFDGLLTEFSERMDKHEAASAGHLQQIVDLSRRNTIERDGLLAEIVVFRRERDTIMDEIRSVRSERQGLLDRLNEVRHELTQSLERWTPIQNLIDRMIDLVWKIFWLLISLVVVVVVLASLGLFLYVRLQSNINLLIKGKS